MRDSNQQSLKEALKQYLKEYRLKDKITETQVIGAWPKLMGPSIARHTKELELRKGTLIIRLDSSVLREELSYGKQKIIRTLNEFAGEELIKDILLA